MQEVDRFTNQQDLEGKETVVTQDRALCVGELSTRGVFVYLAGLLHSEERWNH